jgi:outer membrane protein OmpA-like peptidoglycan-associated protein/tetratricopeptide (TPR) repeat protein
MTLRNAVAYLLLAVTALQPLQHVNAQAPAATEPKKEETKPAANNSAQPDPKSLSWKKNKKAGDKLAKSGGLSAAVPYYIEALNKKPKKTTLNQNIADAALSIRDYGTANTYYKNLVDLDEKKHKKPANIYKYAITLKQTGKYAEAISAFKQFNKLTRDDDDFSEMRSSSNKEIKGAELAIYQRDSVTKRDFRVDVMDANINQPYDDNAPVLKDANSLYYTSRPSDKMVEVNKQMRYESASKIYIAKKVGKTWNKGETSGAAANKDNNDAGNATFSPDGKTMYYTICGPNADNKQICTIYKSNFESGEWMAGSKVGSNVNLEGYTNTQPCLGKNEKGEDVLYFVSNRNEGRGTDIFYAPISAEGTIGKARSTSGINTRGNEMTPYYDFSANVLYFSSDNHPGLGGADVFKTKAEADGNFGAPENMGMPVNSSADDYGFTWNSKQNIGFLASNRSNGTTANCPTCFDDIYTVQSAVMHFAVKGTLYEEMDGNRVAAKTGLVTLYDDNSGTVISKQNLDGSGSYLFDLEAEKSYKIVSRKEGYYEGLSSFNTVARTQSDTLQYDIFLREMPKPKYTGPQVGQLIGTVFYDYDQSRLRADAPDTLNKVVKFMIDNPEFVLEVGSHTDGRGSDEYNDDLGKKRSDAVIRYLVSKKVPAARLASKSYGKRVPVAPNENPDGSDNPDGRSKNRRTEFKLIDKVKK